MKRHCELLPIVDEQNSLVSVSKPRVTPVKRKKFKKETNKKRRVFCVFPWNGFSIETYIKNERASWDKKKVKKGE